MNYSARERFAQLMQSQGQAMAAPVQGTRSSQMLSAVRMANGGSVNSLPTLQEMSNPNYQFQGVQLGANAPFTQFNPIVPMFSLEAPAFGGMEQSTYDFTAPVVDAGRMYQPPRQEPVMTESTSAYRPVDATTVMDSSGNIPNVPSDPYAPPDPYTFVDPNTPAPYVPPVAQTQPVAQPAPVISQPAPVAPPAGVATTGTSIPTVITAEERAAREAAGIQAELERRMAADRAAQEAAAQEEALRLQREEQERIVAARAQADEKARAAAAQAQADAQAAAQAAAQAQADEKARADAAAAAQAEQDRIAAAKAEQDRIAAAAAEEERRREMLWLLSPFLAELGNVPRPAGMEAPAAPRQPTYDMFGNEDPGPEYYAQLNQEGA